MSDPSRLMTLIKSLLSVATGYPNENAGTFAAAKVETNGIGNGLLIAVRDDDETPADIRQAAINLYSLIIATGEGESDV